MLAQFLLVAILAHSDPTHDALKHAGEALYLELELDKVEKRLIKRYAPKDKTLIFLINASKIANDRKITLSWEF